MRVNLRFAVFFFFFLVIAVLMTACTGTPAPVQSTSVSTALLPTWIAQTVSAGALETEQFLSQPDASSTAASLPASPSATRAATTTLSAMGPSPTASITPTPTNTSLPTQPTRTPAPSPTSILPLAAVQIRRPGPLSYLVSPLTVQARVRPGPDGRIRIELLGEDGRLLVRQIVNYGQESGLAFITQDLEFEIASAAETARLVISTYDSFSRLVTLQSVDVILLSLGETNLNPPGTDLEPVIVQEPLPNKLIQGGTLLLEGLSRLPDDQPILVELITAAGKVVGYRQAAVFLDPEGGYAPFNVEIPYTVEDPTWVRLTVKLNSPNRIPGIVYSTSFEVLLSP